jgi:hypothetical protein
MGRCPFDVTRLIVRRATFDAVDGGLLHVIGRLPDVSDEHMKSLDGERPLCADMNATLSIRAVGPTSVVHCMERDLRRGPEQRVQPAAHTMRKRGTGTVILMPLTRAAGKTRYLPFLLLLLGPLVADVSITGAAGRTFLPAVAVLVARATRRALPTAHRLADLASMLRTLHHVFQTYPATHTRRNHEVSGHSSGRFCTCQRSERGSRNEVRPVIHTPDFTSRARAACSDESQDEHRARTRRPRR